MSVMGHSLIDELQVSCKKGDRNYHPSYQYYTTISTLALMLINNKIRLTSILSPRLNDLREPDEFGPQGCKKSTYLVCFSAGMCESNAMWGLYGVPADEAIMIRIPSKTMGGLVKGGLSLLKKNAMFSWGMTAEESGALFEPITANPRRAFHDVAYFSNSRDDGQSDKKLILWRNDPKPRRFELQPKYKSDLLTLVGYVKRKQWLYESETRFQLDYDKPQGEHVYLDLPEQFMKKITVVLGPNFNMKKQGTLWGPSPRQILLRFCEQGGSQRICKSSFYGKLNYAGTTPPPRKCSLVYKKQQVIKESSTSPSLMQTFYDCSK